MSFTLEARLTWECMSVSSCKVQMLSSEGVIGRRSLLSEAALPAGSGFVISSGGSTGGQRESGG